MHAKRLVVIAAAAAIAVSVLMAARADGPPAKTGTRIAVVDVAKVFNQLAEKNRIDADLSNRRNKLLQEQHDKTEELKKYQEDLHVLHRDTPDFDKKFEEAQKKALEFKIWGPYEEEKLRNFSALQYGNLYRKILDAIKAVAQQPGNDYDLVLFKEEDIDFSEAKPEAINTIIQVRKVLYSDEKLDISEQVMTRMNNDFNNRMDSGRGPATAPAP